MFEFAIISRFLFITNEAKIDLELNFTNIKERIIKKLDEFKDADTLIGKKED